VHGSGLEPVAAAGILASLRSPLRH
jgi:hypothetical protein